MRQRRVPFGRVVLGAAVAAFLLVGAAAYRAGSESAAPAPRKIGSPPSGFAAEAVAFESPSGSRIVGWLKRGAKGRGAVMLMHGIRGSRLQMLERAGLLAEAGLSVLLFDFQSHGESAGTAITFGYREARDARAGFDFLRRALPGERIGVIGMSLGGAAAVLAESPIDADAMVLEAVYGTFDEALSNRMQMQAGAFADVASAVLRVQIRPRLGFDPAELRPADRISRNRSPLLLVAGSADRHATMAETRRIFANANSPKDLWIVDGAPHTDFLRHSPDEYRRRVIPFLVNRLAQ